MLDLLEIVKINVSKEIFYECSLFVDNAIRDKGLVTVVSILK